MQYYNSEYFKPNYSNSLTFKNSDENITKQNNKTEEKNTQEASMKTSDIQKEISTKTQEQTTSTQKAIEINNTPQNDVFISSKNGTTKNKINAEKIISILFISALALMGIGAVSGFIKHAKNIGNNIFDEENPFIDQLKKTKPKPTTKPLTKKQQQFIIDVAKNLKKDFGIKNFTREKFFLRQGIYDKQWNLISHNVNDPMINHPDCIKVFRSYEVKKIDDERILRNCLIEIYENGTNVALAMENYNYNKHKKVFTYYKF